MQQRILLSLSLCSKESYCPCLYAAKNLIVLVFMQQRILLSLSLCSKESYCPCLYAAKNLIVLVFAAKNLINPQHVCVRGLLASETSETLSGVYKFELVRYVYIYVWRYVCHNSSACHVYVMWAELDHSHFLYVSAVSNVTNGNGTGTKNVLKGTVRFGLGLVSSLLSSRRYYCSESKTILYLDTVYCKFLLYVSVEINPFKHRYFSTQTNLVYLGLVYVAMITGTRS